MQSMKSWPKGFVFDFARSRTGPDQTRKPDAFAAWVGSAYPGIHLVKDSAVPAESRRLLLLVQLLWSRARFERQNLRPPLGRMETLHVWRTDIVCSTTQ